MNSTTIITLAVAALAVLGLAVVLTASRRSDVGGVGSLSRETRKRDRSVAKKQSHHLVKLNLKHLRVEVLLWR